MSYLKEMKILYVEDDKATMDALHRFLKRRCGKVYCASDAESGIEQYRIYEPDILIVDLILPGMNGLEMIDMLRRDGCRAPAIITTTINETETIINSIKMDICAYIIKPIDTAELEETLEREAETLAVRRARMSSIKHLDLDGTKGRLEEEIRTALVRLIKSSSGKGPGKTDIYLGHDFVQVTFHDAYTDMEKTIYAVEENRGFVRQIREFFYRSVQETMERLIEERTGVLFSLAKISVDTESATDCLYFFYKE